MTRGLELSERVCGKVASRYRVIARRTGTAGKVADEGWIAIRSATSKVKKAKGLEGRKETRNGQLVVEVV